MNRTGDTLNKNKGARQEDKYERRWAMSKNKMKTDIRKERETSIERPWRERRGCKFGNGSKGRGYGISMPLIAN